MRSFHSPGRSLVYGTRAMCATSHPAASLTAIEILRRGGNAVDAAIAASAMLAVVEPHMTGIGGDCFALLWKPDAGLIGLNGAGRAPLAAEAEWFAKERISELEDTSAHTVTVPGAIDAWATLLNDHGTMTFADVLEPAIQQADEGFPIAPRVAWDWAGVAEKLCKHVGAKQHLFLNGAVPKAGQVIRFPALANTLRLIGKGGRNAFYTGEIAEDIVDELKALGGLHTLEDFAVQRCSYVAPISGTYGDLEIFELPPSNQGVTALVMLNLLSRIPNHATDPVCAKRYHLIMEAARLAYAVRDEFVADPDQADVPLAHMLSDALADELAERIDPDMRVPDLGPIPTPPETDTVYLSVVDESGMAVSFINSLFQAFGSGIVTRKTGVTLHNRALGFRLEAGHRNSIAPRKRPLHTLVPAMALKDGKPAVVFGVMGAAFQPTGHVYVLSNMIDYGMDPQEALDCPRVFFEEDALGLEQTIPEDVEKQLQDMGHKTMRVDAPWGGGQIIAIDRHHGVLAGASEPRKDGLALGY